MDQCNLKLYFEEPKSERTSNWPDRLKRNPLLDWNETEKNNEKHRLKAFLQKPKLITRTHFQPQIKFSKTKRHRFPFTRRPNLITPQVINNSSRHQVLRLFLANTSAWFSLRAPHTSIPPEIDILREKRKREMSPRRLRNPNTLA